MTVDMPGTPGETTPVTPLDVISATALADLLVGALNLLQTFEREDLSGADRRRLVAEAGLSLSPLSFSPPEEPRTTLLLSLRPLARRPSILMDAVLIAVSRRDFPPQARVDLLELLVDCDPIDGEQLAHLLVDDPAIAGLPLAFSFRVQTALLYLAGQCGPMPALALAERLRRRGTLTLDAALAVLRTAASRQPSLLAAALGSVQAEIAAATGEPARLRCAVKDLVRRAGGRAFLHALTNISLSDLRPLVEAAFLGEEAPFIVRWTPDQERVAISWTLDGRKEQVLSSALAQRDWYLELCSSAGIRPLAPELDVGTLIEHLSASAAAETRVGAAVMTGPLTSQALASLSRRRDRVSTIQ